MTWTIASPLFGGGSTIKGEKEIRESQERRLTWEGEGEGERDIGKWKMSLALCLSLVFIDDFVFGWEENLRKIKKVATRFFLS